MNTFLALSIAFSIALLSSGCGCAKSQDNNNNTTLNKGKQMARQTTDSGLEYEVLSKGNGVAPKKGQIIKAHYTGWLNDHGQLGTKFDSSVDRGQPLEFVVGVGQVIRGWDEGLMLMHVGDKFRLYIPSHLAYGPHGAGNIIKPNSDLIFDVELVSVG